jgi:hypothetical protein
MHACYYCYYYYYSCCLRYAGLLVALLFFYYVWYALSLLKVKYVRPDLTESFYEDGGSMSVHSPLVFADDKAAANRGSENASTLSVNAF